MTDATRVLASLPLDQLHDSPYQPRTHYAGLEGLANGKRLADFEVKASAAKGEADKARSAGQEVDDDAADGGERDPNTGDMFEESHA